MFKIPRYRLIQIFAIIAIFLMIFGSLLSSLLLL